jgi:cell wall-associated NlpC family hydrolase
MTAPLPVAGARRLVLTGAVAAASLVGVAALASAQEGLRTSPPYAPVPAEGPVGAVVPAASVPAPGAEAPFAAFSRSALALRDSVVALARAQLGKRYRHGGESPKRGFDCSGLVAFVLNSLNLTVPRTAAQQATVGTAVVRDTSQLLPGDLITFGRGKKVTHIGIYVGNGRFIQASSRAGRVVETKLFRPPAPGIKPWAGVRRVVNDSALGPRPLALGEASSGGGTE